MSKRTANSHYNQTSTVKKSTAISGIICLASGLSIGLLSGCASVSKSGGTISEAPFGKTSDGTPVEIYTLRNQNGMEARIMTYGGIVQSLQVPDKSGNLGDVVLGYDNLDGYLTNHEQRAEFLARRP